MKTLKSIIYPYIDPKANWKNKILQDWPSIIGDLSSKVHVEKITNNTLVLGVHDSCWMQELYVLSSPLLKTINRHLNKPYIKKLQFKNIPKKKPEYRRLIKSKNIIKSNNFQIKKVEKDALEKISDPQLKDCLVAYLSKCYEEKK